MKENEVYDSFGEYLNSKGIVLYRKKEEDIIANLKHIDEAIVNKQLENINEFHKRVLGYNSYKGERLENKTGNTVEQYKVNIKRMKRYLKNIRMNGASSNFERALLRKGNDYIQRAEASITEIYNSGYVNILERSMGRNEICLGNTYFDNLAYEDKLIVANIDKCAYNNVEMDCFYLLGRLKRKGINLDYRLLIARFCCLENLDNRSFRFLLALLSYPYAFMKCSNRYREKSKEWSEEEYDTNLEKALNKDGYSLLGG